MGLCSDVVVRDNSSWLGTVGPCRAVHMILSLVHGFHSRYINNTNNHNSLGHEQPLSMSLMCFNTTHILANTRPR